MSRELKTIMESSIRQRFESVESCIVIDYQRINAEKTHELRSSLRRHGVRINVVHNRLAKRVFSESEVPEDFKALLKGPTAVVWGVDDGAVSASKYVAEWRKENPELAEVRGGLFQGKTLLPEEVQTLAELPDLPTMQSMVTGMFLGPLTLLATLAEQLPGHFAGCVAARKDSLDEGGDDS
jgi:large subunit ribosomal protein L10